MGWVWEKAQGSQKGIFIKWIVSFVFRLSPVEDGVDELMRIGLRVTWCCQMHSCVTYLTCFVTSELYDTCLVLSTVSIFHYRQHSQCDKLPFMKFTTCCPLNPILYATKINPLKCKTYNVIRRAHCREHFGTICKCSSQNKSPLLPHALLSDCRARTDLSFAAALTALSSSLFPLFYFMIMELNSLGNRHRSSRTEYQTL